MNKLEEILDLPNELLELTHSPIPQNFSTPFNTTDTKPINAKPSKLTPLNSIDQNLASSRPKRTAALIASNSFKSNFKRKLSDVGSSDTSNKENIDPNESKTKLRKRKKSSKSSQNENELVKHDSLSLQESKSSLEHVVDSNKEQEIILFLSQQKNLLENCLINETNYDDENLKQLFKDSNNNNTIRFNYELNDTDENNCTLKLTCESDPEQDNYKTPLNTTNLEIKSYQQKLINPKSNNNNLILNEFVVNSNSCTSLHTPTKINKHFVNDYLCFDDSNYEFELDELGFTICRAKQPDLEQHILHLDYKNSLPISQSSEQDKQDIDKVDSSETILFNNIDLLNIDCGKLDNEYVGYCLNVCKVLFNKEELTKGIFVDSKKKNKSKNRVPFDNHRTQILKEALIAKFKLNPSQLDDLWKDIRSHLNRKLYFNKANN